MSREKYTLGDLSISIQPGPFGSQLHSSDYAETGVPIVMPKDMKDGKILHSGLLKVPEEHAKRLSRHQVHAGNLMIARKGDVRKCILVTDYEDGWMTGSDCLKVVLDTEKCYPPFIYYQLRSPYIGRWMEMISIGATMPSLNTRLLSSIEISLPNYVTQVHRSNFLVAYDKLIENNQKQIKLLEEAAQRLYKEWFVDLRFPGYEDVEIIDGIPEGWKRKTVGEVIDKPIRAKQIKASDYLEEGSIPVIDQSRDFIAGYTNDNESVVQRNVPIIVFGDHTRILKYISFPFAKGADGTQLILSKDECIPQAILFLALMNIDLSNYHYARHFKYLKAEEVLISSKNIAAAFEKIVNPIFEQIQTLRNMMMQATEARDRLLPKLMSGELEV